MSIAMLDRPPAPPVVEQSVCRLVAEAAECLARAGRTQVESLDNDGLGEAVSEVARVESRAAALRLALSTEADRRRVADETAETGTDAWLAQLTGSTREQVAGGLRIAGLLRDKYAATRAAFAAGELRLEQVRVIVNAAEQAPVEASAQHVSEAEEWLVAKATGAGTRSGRPTDAKRLRQAARRMFAAIDHDLADRHEAILLGRETRTAEAETFLALHDNGDGTFSGRFRIPELHGQLLTQALDRLTSPRRLSRDRAGDPVVDESAPGHDWGANIYETRGAAWCELIEHLPTRGHAANGCELLVRIDLDALLTGLGIAGLDTGVAITAGEARRLACNAGLVPAVLDGDSMPLDLGQLRRLHSRTQRRALALIHDTCAVAGCERPFAWCEIHHQRLAWVAGGPTDLDNGLPLWATTTAEPMTPASTSGDDRMVNGPSIDARDVGGMCQGRPVPCDIGDARDLAGQLDQTSMVELQHYTKLEVESRTFGYIWEPTVTLGLRQTIAEQQALVGERPEVFEVQFTAYGYGWVVVHLEGVDRDELAELVFEAWRLTAPAELVAARGDKLPV